jgi:hypothetical protein
MCAPFPQLARNCARPPRVLRPPTPQEAAFNQFQLEKDRINHLWIVAKKALEDKKAELRNKEREMQDIEERHAVEIKVYKQRVKHLVFEHHTERTEVKTTGQGSLKLAQDDHRESEQELRQDLRSLVQIRKEMEVSHETYLRE